MFFTRDKKFYKSFIVLCLTLMLEQAVILSVNLADNMMLGVYNEISLSDIGSADGKGLSIEEDNELMHLIVVFKKGYKLTDNDKNVIKKLGLDYMFER